MTVLRRADLDLHHEDGTHIEVPSGFAWRNERARMARHLARHAREDLPDLSMLGQDLAEADRLLEEAREHRESVKKYVIEQARLHKERGVKEPIIADRLGVNVRTLQDWLKYGHVRSRSRARPGK